MRRNSSLLITLIVVCLLQHSCKRYEEGGFINNQAENKIRGFKKISEYNIDGIDSLASLNSVFGNNDYYFSFLTNDLGNVVNTYSAEHLIQKNCSPGFWELGNDKKSITMQLRSPADSACNNSTVMPFSMTQWKIIRLKKKDMRLETTVNGKLYEIYFVTI